MKSIDRVPRSGSIKHVRIGGLIAKRWRVVGGVMLVAALGYVLAIAVAGGLLWKKGPPPQIVTLPNGEKYRFAGATYSTTAVPPSLAARAVSWLPAPVADLARKRFAASLSQNRPGDKFPSPQLMVWFRRLGSNAVPAASRYNPIVVLADQAGVVAGHDGLAGDQTGTAWLFAAFSLVPKRSRVLECNFYRGFDDGLIGKVSFANPLYGQFPQWQPEPVPIVKRVEDLEVRLERLQTGYPPPRHMLLTDPPPEGFETELTTPKLPLSSLGPELGYISLRSSAGSNTWVLRDAELSDGTGNRLLDSWANVQGLRTNWASGYIRLTQGTLWPNEAAWRLKLEFNRPAGLASGDLVTFSNVPILKAGAPRPIKRTAAFGPYQVVLEETMVQNGQGSGFLKWRLELLNPPDGLAAQVARAMADTGAQLPVLQRFQPAEARPGGGYDSVEQFAMLSGVPTNATAVDVTCAIQKKRTVEFLVKPPKPQ